MGVEIDNRVVARDKVVSATDDMKCMFAEGMLRACSLHRQVLEDPKWRCYEKSFQGIQFENDRIWSVCTQRDSSLWRPSLSHIDGLSVNPVNPRCKDNGIPRQRLRYRRANLFSRGDADGTRRMRIGGEAQ